MSNVFIEFGTKRTVQKRFRANTSIALPNGILYIKEDSLMDVVEVFTKASDSEGWWITSENLHETIRPAPPRLIRPPQPVRIPVSVRPPEPEPEPLSLWTRFWAWVRRRPLPVARLLPPREVKT